MQPLAIAVIGGLGVAMALTLVVIPCLYRIFQGLVATLARSLTRRQSDTATGAPRQ